MSADFSKILVKDDRLEVVDNIKYAVIKGGQNVTPSQFKAISVSNNQLVFNIQVPSEQTIIDRRVLLQTDLTLVVTSAVVTTTAAALPVATLTAPAHGCGYGTLAGLAPYPIHQLISVASTTINNNTVTVNTQDVLPAILRMLDKEELGAYNGTSATATDSYLSYTDAIGTVGNSINGFGSANLDTNFVGRGSIALINYSAATVGVAPSQQLAETFTWRISEPLMLSPWIYCNPKTNGQGFYGIQNMNIVLNIDSTVSRVFRGLQGINGIADAKNFVTPVGTVASPSFLFASPGGTVFTTAGGATPVVCESLPVITSVTAPTNMFSSNTSLLFTFLTPHPSDLMPARNIVPYYELPRFISQNPAVPALVADTSSVAATGNSYIKYDNTAGTTFVSQTLQLNQIPDKLILFISKQGKSWGDSDSTLPITHISIDFNNNSGLLSAARCEDLYRMSKDNGSNQNWLEWSGYANTASVPGVNGESNLSLSANGVTLDGGVPIASFKTVPTCGSMLMLEFGKDIQLIEDFFAPGSLGNFNIRVNIYYLNNNPSIKSGDQLQLTMITLNSGVFVCERGTSSTYTGILTRADVLEASEQDAYTHSDVRRLVGGGFLDMLKSGVSKLAPMLKSVAPILAPMAKNYLANKGTLGQMAAQGIGAMGYGRSGGGSSGGALHGRYQ